MYTELLQLYQHNFILTRFGNNGDGGYVIPQDILKNCKNLISCGISNDVSFENDYIKFVPDLKIYAYDGTINNFPSNNHINFIWEKFNISLQDTNTTITLDSIFNKYNLSEHVCVKMDIEGAEYETLTNIDKNNFKKIDCLILEIHNIYNRKIEFNNLINLINTEFALIHKHDNNCGQYFNAENTIFADVYELTYINKQLLTNIIPLEHETLPLNKLDYPNCNRITKIFLN